MSDSPYTKLSREEMAQMEVGNTLISRPMSLVVTAAFILTIISVPVVQHIVEVRAGFAGRRDDGYCRLFMRFSNTLVRLGRL